MIIYRSFMYRKLIIFYLFYLVGVILSPVFASAELGLDKNLVLGLAENISEDGPGINELLKRFPEVDEDDHPVNAYYLSISAKYTHGARLFKQRFLHHDWVSSLPLYLLFHSFLFYDLV